MKKTLEEIIKESEKGDIGNAVKVLGEYLKSVDEQKQNEFHSIFEDINESLKELISIHKEGHKQSHALLEKILNKEEESIEFPKIQEVSMAKPDWYEEYDWDAMYQSWTKMLVKAFRPFFEDIKNIIAKENSATRASLESRDQIEEKEEQEIKTVSTGSVRSRRTTQWSIATFPQISGTAGLISAGDNLTYYLPDSCIPNSETIRLNGGNPLSHGIDYTITGNQIVFVQNQSNSQIEVRWQKK